MVNESEAIRLLFGLKIRELRQKQNLSFQEMAEETGLSTSYLNEIERGKKYPKTDKILLLAQVLKVDYDYLVSRKMSRKLEPIAELLKSEFFKEFPMSMFGIDPNSLLDVLTEAPDKINAFINAIIEIARGYELRQEKLFAASLRAYQELNDNYFPELEQLAKDARQQLFQGQQPNLPLMEQALKDNYGVVVDYQKLPNIELMYNIRSIVSEDGTKLYINQPLRDSQKGFILARELGFQFMGLKRRPRETPMVDTDSFEVMLNNMKASYFAVALLIDEEEFVDAMEQFWKQERFNPDYLLTLSERYNATPEMIMQRLTNVLPQYFGIKNMFFLRFEHGEKHKYPVLTKELHFSQLHNPYANELNEHYCTRWLSLRVLDQMGKMDSRATVCASGQVSQYDGSDNEYLLLGIGTTNVANTNDLIAVTLGFLADENFKQRVAFMNDAKLSPVRVGVTCERCAWQECPDRQAQPLILQKQERVSKLKAAMASL